MIKSKDKPYTTPYFYENFSSYKNGLSYQRELFKQANLMREYDIMSKCLENIKNEIKAKAIKKGLKDSIIRIEKVILWFESLDHKYRVKTENGYELRLPEDIENKISKNLNISYQREIEIMNELGLLS